MESLALVKSSKPTQKAITDLCTVIAEIEHKQLSNKDFILVWQYSGRNFKWIFACQVDLSICISFLNRKG